MSKPATFDQHIEDWWYSLPPSFRHTGFKSPITEVAVILLSSKGGVSHAFGTAVIIGGNIALTARHVLDDFYKHHEGVGIDGPHNGATFNLKALQFVENGMKAWAWHVTQIWHDNTDLAFLRLQPTAEEQLN